MEDEMTRADGSPQAWVPLGRLDGLPPHPLADVPDIKARLLAEGRSLIDLGVGDPGLPVPDLAEEAGRRTREAL